MLDHSPIRLLFILPSICRAGGGVSEAARLLAHGLARRRDIALEVVTARSPHFDEDRPTWPDVPIHVFERSGGGRFGYTPDMMEFLKTKDADIAHVHGLWMYHVLAAARWSKRWKKPVVVTPHGMLEPWIMRRSRHLKRLVSFFIQTPFLKRAAMIQALTRKEVKDIARVVSTERVEVIPNFVLPPEAEGPRPAWWCPEMKGRRVVLFLGRIHEKKGWRELCDAWDALSQSDADFAARIQLVFCGWVNDAPAFESRVAELARRHGNITYAGPQFGAEKAASFRAAEAFILPSKSEGLPMVILEAWAAGLRVMMTEACNLPEGFERGAAIRIGEDAATLTADLRAYFARPEAELRAIAEAGRALQAEHYSEQAVCDRFAQAFHRIVGR